jgi:hypothetical protein
MRDCLHADTSYFAALPVTVLVRKTNAPIRYVDTGRSKRLARLGALPVHATFRRRSIAR